MNIEVTLPRGYIKPYLIQRMTMINKDFTLRFSKRFRNHYMGASEFEWGEQAKRLRELHERSEVAELAIEGIAIKVLYNPNRMKIEQIKTELTALFRHETRTKEYTGFDREGYDNRPKPNTPKSFDEKANAWFDIENGVFWTWEKILITDVRKNIANSIRYMDAVKEDKWDRQYDCHIDDLPEAVKAEQRSQEVSRIQQEKTKEKQDRRDAASMTLREQRIAAGLIKPSN